MTHNNLLCILSFRSWNLIFQLLNFFFLENGSILRSEIRIFIPRRDAGDVSRRAPDASWWFPGCIMAVHLGECQRGKINTVFTGLQRRKSDLQAVLYREYKKHCIALRKP
jgi:hypothetical protein